MAAESQAPTGLGALIATASSGMSIALLAFLIASRLFYKQWHMSRDFEFDRLAIVALAAAFAVLGPLAARLRARMALAGFSTLASLSLALLACLALSVDVSGRIKQVVAAAVFRDHPPDIYRPDERYGYLLRPNAQDRDRTPDYDVLYTVDAAGHRVTQSPASPRATLLIAGDSFVFGTGVNDTESFPYRIGAEHWPDVHVINAGVGGWGVTQGYLTVIDALARPPLPTLILYGMIPDDQFRSYLRTPVTVGIARRLEFVDGELIMRDVARGAPLSPVTTALLDREVALNLALLLKMNQACRDQQVGFAVLLMQDDGRFAPDLIYGLAANAIPIVDATRLRYERFPHDYHPNAADHQRIAQAVAHSVVAEMLARRQSGQPWP